VLPPELTSEVSAARFRQEIDLAAHLQHPHVLSVLASGAKGDLLYYIMPYVSGESLRHRLASSGRLPIADAVRILREISDALAYAHRKGIVHRDIKPENILLQEGHALLADFGVARAIDAAREGTLTGTGISVGTPAYMAPEQAAAEPNIDARADLYALGVVGYEMLTGELPFSGSSAQAVLVAQLTAPPPPTVHLRSDTPLGVNAAIARSLAKAPADRFATAEEFRDALDVTIAPTSPRMGWRALVGVGFAALAAVGVAAALRSNRHALVPEALDVNLIAVAPFDVTDTTLKLWHEGMVDVLSRNLDGAGSLHSVSPSVVISRWSGRADPISAVALGRSTGASLAIIGSLIRSGPDSVRAAVSLIDVSSGRTLGDVIDRRDATSRIDQLSDTLSMSLLRALARSRLTGPMQRSSLGTSSLPALKDFLQGEQLYRQSHFDSALVFFQRAVAIDSTFALAFKRASDAIVWGARDPDDLGTGYATRALRYNHGLSPRDSILITLIPRRGSDVALHPGQRVRRPARRLRRAACRCRSLPERSRVVVRARRLAVP
jgi:serine/threonine protein kinase